MNRTSILNQLEKAIQLAKEMTGRDLRAEGWATATNNRKKALGVCKYHSKTLEISYAYAQQITEEEVWDTCLHEVAHALVGSGEGHGPTWKRTFLKLGGSGNVRFSGDVDHKEMGANYFLIDDRTGEEVACYYRRPSRNFSACYRKNDPASQGHLRLVDSRIRHKYPDNTSMMDYLAMHQDTTALPVNHFSNRKAPKPKKTRMVTPSKAPWLIIDPRLPVREEVITTFQRFPHAKADSIHKIMIKGDRSTLGQLRLLSQEDYQRYIHYKETGKDSLAQSVADSRFLPSKNVA